MESNGRKNPDSEQEVDPVEGILEIDPHQAEAQWVEHPKRFYQLSVLQVKADKRVRDSEANLELVKAELARKVRRRPQKYGLPRGSEAAINSLIITFPEYQEAKADCNNAQYEADMAKAAVQAMWHRKKGIEQVCEFELGNLGCQPRQPRNYEARNKLEQAEKEAVRKPVRRKS